MVDEKIVKEARKIIESFFKGRDYDPEVDGEAGVFVTLRKGGELRGCIGVPIPMDLKKALKEAALGAINDPRFPPVSGDEMEDITVEVSVLTPPERVSDPLKEIKVGKHGIIIRYGPYSGLLLPQVPVEEGWSLEEFLDYGCLKAGLPPGCWRNEGVEIYRFEAVVYEEERPKGKVVKRELDEEQR